MCGVPNLWGAQPRAASPQPRAVRCQHRALGISAPTPANSYLKLSKNIRVEGAWVGKGYLAEGKTRSWSRNSNKNKITHIHTHTGTHTGFFMASIEVAWVLHTGTTCKRIFWKNKPHTQQTLLLPWRGLFKAKKKGLHHSCERALSPWLPERPVRLWETNDLRGIAVCHCERKEMRGGCGREGGCPWAQPPGPPASSDSPPGPAGMRPQEPPASQ